eukprot:gnl/MRDRNA2_/MRDRNA2_32274_c0_seq1.p1 gnl/MRDRNA2_/MRDRNA2_32274_c0~~gnl/MRDRNA2_/MRDRNA2_32274_c0_seq1.p1  ORF type:complete len:237 (+),score=26.53 gnl/MRDRNA2_/MRDRNA2_32274_c0_seq1:85-711(+)
MAGSGTCTSVEFWALVGNRGASGFVKRLFQGVLPGEAVNCMADCFSPFPDLTAELWAKIVKHFDKPSIVDGYFNLSLRRIKGAAIQNYPNFDWGSVSDFDYGDYPNSPLRLCAEVYFYRQDTTFHPGFTADVFGKLTNGFCFYYREGTKDAGCGGVAICETYAAIVAPTLRKLVEDMQAEDLYDIAHGCVQSRLSDCECRVCRRRTRY